MRATAASAFTGLSACALLRRAASVARLPHPPSSRGHTFPSNPSTDSPWPPPLPCCAERPQQPASFPAHQQQRLPLHLFHPSQTHPCLCLCPAAQCSLSHPPCPPLSRQAALTPSTPLCRLTLASASALLRSAASATRLARPSAASSRHHCIVAHRTYMVWNRAATCSAGSYQGIRGLLKNGTRGPACASF